MLLQFTCEGKTIYEGRTKDLPPEVKIGRGAKCDWQIPKNQVKASRRHAKLIRSGDQVIVRDWESRNGILYAGAKIDEKTLSPGDCVDIGGCLLTAEKEPDPPKPTVPKHSPRLLARSGSLKGQVFAIGPDGFTIGSDDDCSLTISDPMVSRQHAAIRPGPDGTWTITDEGSTNGTMVNGKRLTEGEACSLRRGTRLFLAQYAFQFDDGKGMPVERRPILYGTVVLLAAAMLLVGLRFCITKQAFSFPRRNKPKETPVIDDKPTHKKSPLAALDELNAEWPPPVDDVSEKLAEAAANAGDRGGKAKASLAALKALIPAVEVCAQADTLLGELRLRELEALTLNSPPDSKLQAHAALNMCAKTIQKRFETAMGAGKLLKDLVAAENAMSIDAFIAAWSNETEIEEVLKWDGSKREGLDRNRTAPVNAVDKLLGIEDLQTFYLKRRHRLRGSLRPPPATASTPFTTVIVSSQELLPAITAFLGHIDENTAYGWPEKRFADKVQQCRRAAALRDELVAKLSARAAASKEREQLMAAAIALQLARRPEDVMTGSGGSRTPLDAIAIDAFDASPELLTGGGPSG